jgi:hypothetical protein
MAPVPHQTYNQHTSRTISTSEDEEDSTYMTQEIPWQTVKGMERKKHRASKDSIKQDIPLDNRYHVLTDSRNDDTNTGTTDLKAAKPPPVFVYRVTSLPEMQKRLNKFLDDEQYTTKSMANDTVKLTCQSPDTYRKLATYMRDNNIIHHTYQPKEERSHQVVIKYLHHSVDI